MFVLNSRQFFKQLIFFYLTIKKITMPATTQSLQSLWVGQWAYNAFYNVLVPTDPTNPSSDIEEYNLSQLGKGMITIEATDIPNQLIGTIGGQEYTWSLDLTGSLNYGDPFTLRMQGKGMPYQDANGATQYWVYEYVGYMVNPWQNGVNQVPSFVGSVIRQVPHPSGSDTHEAGVVGSFICLKVPDAIDAYDGGNYPH